MSVKFNHPHINQEIILKTKITKECIWFHSFINSWRTSNVSLGTYTCAQKKKKKKGLRRKRNLRELLSTQNKNYSSNFSRWNLCRKKGSCSESNTHLFPVLYVWSSVTYLQKMYMNMRLYTISLVDLVNFTILPGLVRRQGVLFLVLYVTMSTSFLLSTR